MTDPSVFRTEAYWSIVDETQAALSEAYASAVDENDRTLLEETLKPAVRQYLASRRIALPGATLSELADRVYTEMAGCGLLTPLLEREDLEEININAWNDIALTYRDGRTEKYMETFRSPTHAEDILKRLLRHSGSVLDNSSPASQGHLPGNTRVTALKTPLVDPETGVAASIRLLRPRSVTLETLLETGFASEEMLTFLVSCARCGVPFVIAGATSSGKTTLLNAVLGQMPDGMRIFTIESGARELSLVRSDSQGKIRNNVVHTLSRPSDRPESDVSQEDLVALSLRFNPDLIVVGEMRDVECAAAVESGLTGHTVLSTVHASSGESAHTRIAMLCQKRFPIAFEASLSQAAEAFPVVVYTRQRPDGRRLLADLTECVRTETGQRIYRCLYAEELKADGNREPSFVKKNPPSDGLLRRLLTGGLDPETLERFRSPNGKRIRKKTAPKGDESACSTL